MGQEYSCIQVDFSGTIKPLCTRPEAPQHNKGPWSSVSPLRSVCPPNPVHHPTRHLPGWGHDTPPRADLESGLCLLPCLKHRKGFFQFLACPITVCTNSCEQRPCSTGTPRTPQLLGSTRTSHTGACGAHLHHSCHLLPCPAAQPSRPQEDSPASHLSHSRTPREQAKQLPCPSACGTRNSSEGGHGVSPAMAALLLPTPKKSAFQ